MKTTFLILPGILFGTIHKEVVKPGFARKGKNVIPYVLNNEVYAGYIKASWQRENSGTVYRWSKYYLYYRCTKHVEKNISGPWLHQQMEDTLSLLSLKSERVQYIIKATESRLKGSLAYRDRESQAKVKYMREIDSKVEILEQRFMCDSHTKTWSHVFWRQG